MPSYGRPLVSAVALGLVLAGCSAEEPAPEPTSEPPLGEFAPGECELTSSSVPAVEGVDVAVSTLPVFTDYPGRSQVHYDDRSGDYMDERRVTLGEEDEHRLSMARDRALLILRPDGDLRLSESSVEDLAVNGVEFEDSMTYCMDRIPVSAEYVGSTDVRYPPPTASGGDAFVWELTADEDSLFRDSTPIEDASTNPDRPDTSVLSLVVGGTRAQLFFSEQELLRISPPGSSADPAREPAFDILDFYEENRP